MRIWMIVTVVDREGREGGACCSLIVHVYKKKDGVDVFFFSHVR